MLRRALLLALLAAALAAAPAQAAGTIARDGTTLRISDTAAIWISIAQTGNQIAITLFSGTELQPQPGSNCSLSGTLITCTGAGALRLVAVGTGDARDEVDVTALGPDLDWEAGGGADRLIARGAAGRMVMRGGAGDDFFEGGGAADAFSGGEGSDWIFVSPGGDDIAGGPGFDLLTAPDERKLTVRLNDAADDDLGDGVVANVHADVEDVFSRFGVIGDVLFGSDADNQLYTGGGGDVLVGGGGSDLLHAGDGSDQLFARDGLAEGVDCGDGTDFAQVDDVDTTVDCEVVDASADARPDADVDGVRKPVDCNDGVAGIHPGAPETLDDGIDQDCDGTDAIDRDRDRDGVPRPQDCDDNRAAVRPGALEVPGNDVDENCDKRKAPFPSLPTRVDLRTDAFATHIVVTRLRVSGLARRQRVTMLCRGHGCPFGRRKAAAPKRRRRLELTRPLARRRLAPGTVLRVRISDPRGLTKTFSYVLRSADRPLRTVRCTAPPTRRQRRC